MIIKNIPEYEGWYVITDTGEIFNVKTNHMLRVDLVADKYPRVSLSKDGEIKTYYLHRLMAMTFIPNPENKPHINHKDGNKNNYQLYNLEWCTPSENALHYWRELHRPKGFASKEVVAISPTTNKVEYTFDSQKQAAEYFKIDDSSISKAVRSGGKRKCQGYYWFWKEEYENKVND